jgi:hypothetical protein
LVVAVVIGTSSLGSSAFAQERHVSNELEYVDGSIVMSASSRAAGVGLEEASLPGAGSVSLGSSVSRVHALVELGPTLQGIPFSTAPWAAAHAELSDLPSNLSVPHGLRPILRRVLERSPMFREQMHALARKPQVRMMVTYGGTRGDRPYYALSVVRKHEWGAMFVDTTLYVPADVIELIGHEIEHVREQMEGLDLRKLAHDRGTGVFDLNGHYETMRAIEAGQRVTREFQGIGVEVPTIPMH